MKNILFYAIALFMYSHSVYCQESQDVNLIISVDGKINPGQTAVNLNYTLKSGETKKLELQYVPGSLKISKADFNLLQTDAMTSFSIEIRYTRICRETVKYSFFVIDDLNINLLKNDFFILYIYDLDSKGNRKIFSPLPNKNFTYEYDSPTGPMRRVQNVKSKKEKCN
jgi:hypothetical protein